MAITDRKTLAGVTEVGAGFEEDDEVDPEAAVEVGGELRAGFEAGAEGGFGEIAAASERASCQRAAVAACDLLSALGARLSPV